LYQPQTLIWPKWSFVKSIQGLLSSGQKLRDHRRVVAGNDAQNVVDGNDVVNGNNVDKKFDGKIRVCGSSKVIIYK
jgi:hypothetical protein